MNAEPNLSRAESLPRRLPEYLFALAIVLGACLLMWVHRGIGTFGDEWTFLIHRDGGFFEQGLRQVNGHLMLVPFAVYKLLGAIFWPGAMLPLALLSTALQLLLATLVFVFVRRRGSSWLALLAGVLVMFLGTGWEAIVWSFNINWLGAMAAGLAALLVFESGDSLKIRAGSSLLLVIAVSCSGVGLVFVFAVMIYALWPETRSKAAIVLAAPLLVYIPWFLIFGLDFEQQRYPAAAPHFFLEIAAYGFGGLLGEGVEWGRPLAALAAAAAVFWLSREGKIQPRIAVVLAMPLFFWAASALQRAGWASPNGSRYVLTSVVLILLVIAEATRGKKFNQAGWICVGALFALAIAGNLSAMRTGAQLMRDNYANTRAEATALVIAGPQAANAVAFESNDPGFAAKHVTSAYEFLANAGAKVAYSPKDLAEAAPADRNRVDVTLRALQAPVARRIVNPREVCPTAPAEIHANTAVFRSDGQVKLFTRRFGDSFTVEPQLTIAPGAHVVTIPAGDSGRPWIIGLRGERTIGECPAR